MNKQGREMWVIIVIMLALILLFVMGIFYGELIEIAENVTTKLGDMFW